MLNNGNGKEKARARNSECVDLLTGEKTSRHRRKAVNKRARRQARIEITREMSS